MCSTKECSSVGGCPFSFSDISDQIQNYGCLPTPPEIISMKVHSGKTWACHSNPEKPCLGAINRLKELGYDHQISDPKLVTENDKWIDFTKIDRDFHRELSERDLLKFQNKEINDEEILHIS